MKTFDKRLRSPSMWGLALAGVLVAGCADMPTEPYSANSPSTAPEVEQINVRSLATAALQGALHGDHSRGWESEILRLEATVPGIGGVFFDPPSQSLVVLTTPMADPVRAREAVNVLVAGRALLRSSDQVLRAPSVSVRHADYPFSHLVAWHRGLLEILADVDGWLSIDADERSNRVRIGVATDYARAMVEGLAAGAGVPQEAINVHLSTPMRPLVAGASVPPLQPSTLRDRVRLAGSGLEIQNALGERCSYGWTLTSGQKWGFITAAHCTRHTIGDGSTGEAFHQRGVTANDLLGYVGTHPKWDVSNCTHDGNSYPVCTEADAMWIPVESASDVAKRVAITDDYQYGNDTRGGVDIDYWLDVSNSTGEVVGQIVATGAWKVGRTTGYTGGPIEGTCETHVIEGRLNLCLNRLEGASVGEGDSGGPVFGKLANAIAFGIVVAGGPLNEFDTDDDSFYCERPNGDTCTLLYAPVDQIEAHLGMTFNWES